MKCSQGGSDATEDMRKQSKREQTKEADWVRGVGKLKST